jgi:starch-binding outer membrane protein, SusD/RagB family
MNIIKTICTATAVLLAGMLTSCSDYLDVSKELAKNLDKEEVFSKAKYIKQFLQNR